jgi:Flp pilus assembly pilin Flp
VQEHLITRQFNAGKLRRFRRENHGVAAIELVIMASVMAIAIVTFISDVDDPEGLLGRIKLLVDGIFD